MSDPFADAFKEATSAMSGEGTSASDPTDAPADAPVNPEPTEYDYDPLDPVGSPEPEPEPEP
ncbi:MAG: hypothetical protein ACP5D5_08865, partial [Acidithiobacillus sp.]|uniref:hypothetical protein n=1 Tax=Acidithiobacillus sp. TaxID=1872118 RepID=UPI003CFD2EB2